LLLALERTHPSHPFLFSLPQPLDLPLLARELRPPPHPPREWLHDFWASAAPLTPPRADGAYGEGGGGTAICGAIGAEHAGALLSSCGHFKLLPLHTGGGGGGGGGAGGGHERAATTPTTTHVRELPHTLALPASLIALPVGGEDMAIMDDGWGGAVDANDGGGDGGDGAESPRVPLDELVATLRLPVLDPDFVRGGGGGTADGGSTTTSGYFEADATQPSQLPLALVEKLHRRRAAGRPLHAALDATAAVEVPPRHARALVAFLAAALCGDDAAAAAAASAAGAGGGGAGAGAPELPPKCEVLRELRIFECMGDDDDDDDDAPAPPVLHDDAALTTASPASPPPPPPPPKPPKLVTLERQRYLLREPHPFFTPKGDAFMRVDETTPPSVPRLLKVRNHAGPPSLSRLSCVVEGGVAPTPATIGITPHHTRSAHYKMPGSPSQGLGVLELRDADVFERLLLPKFGAQPLSAQRAQRAHILRWWQGGLAPFAAHAGLCAALRATPFVPVGTALRIPADVIDPRDAVLSYVFGGEQVSPPRPKP